MKTIRNSMFIAIMAGVLADAAFAATRYVNVANPSPVAPYTTWATAATNIQDAVDAASVGDVVLVTNGVYASGESVSPGNTGSNRVVITKNITVRSVNGPAETIISGRGPLGSSAVRCVYMTNGLLSGFTVTNGFTRTSGDLYYDRSGGGVNMRGGNGVVSNCTISGNTAQWNGGGTYYGTVNNCTISGNSTGGSGGGTAFGTVNNCTISGNSAGYGGGTYNGSVNNCVISGNSAGYGGGTRGGTVNNCTISGNSAGYGGGTDYGTVNNCTISGNSANISGGGTSESTVNNCTISGNTADYGGGTAFGTVNNCTISGNTAGDEGGGTYYGRVNNCVISGNTADYGGGTFYGTVNNCVISGNTAGYYGGGMYRGSLLNCTVTENVATNNGGGMYFDSAYDDATNCVIYLNRCINNPASSNWYVSEGFIAYSCAAPLPPGTGNIESDPMFVDAGAGDFHLLEGSPCIDAGTNLPGMDSMKDLDGNPRINAGRVDMGCYEYVPEPVAVIGCQLLVIGCWLFRRGRAWRGFCI